MASAATLSTRSATQAPAFAGPLALLGRLFFALIFLMAGPNHFSSQTIAYAASQGVPLASIAVPFSGVGLPLSADSRFCSVTAPASAPGSSRFF
jgi:uncharacterized membrane protein YphA (DoxX/SURF4 family)